MNMNNVGRLIQLQDGRNVIMYNKQPLIDKGQVLLHLVDHDYNHMFTESGKPSTLIRDAKIFMEEFKAGLHKHIGMVD